MQNEVVFAGFGGQGVMLAGQLLSYAAMDDGFHVVWLPSYGPEMRGGTANCTVVISDIPIASPVVPNPGAAIVMNNPSLEKFGKDIKPGGLLMINTSLVNIEVDRDDIKKIRVPANEIAMKCGTAKAANMVMLGAYLACSGALELQVIKDMFTEKFKHKKGMVELNHKALELGWNVGKEQLAEAGEAGEV
jgi:2-oxoglutarate ferredoxin oxidoreductase subunit gamma